MSDASMYFTPSQPAAADAAPERDPRFGYDGPGVPLQGPISAAGYDYRTGTWGTPPAPPATTSATPPAAGPASSAAPPPPGPGGQPTQDQRDSRAVIDDLLGQYGLSSLSDWAWNEIVNGASPTQVELDLRQTDAFKQRFPAIAAREKAGLPPISPGEYVSLENTYTQVLRAGGLPQGFWDQPADFTDLISGDVSPSELQDRITNGYSAVASAPQSVRDAFSSYYGVQGQSALASLFLDEKRAPAQLEKMAQAAQLGGQASTYGLPIGQQTAETAAGLGISSYRLQTALDQAGQLRPLYAGTVAEGSNISGDQALQAALGISPEDMALIQSRLLGRQAAFAGGGGSDLTRQGLSGLGSAITNS